MEDEKLENNKLYSGYLYKFNLPDLNGKIYTKDTFDYKYINNLKIRGIIKDYEIDENGIKIIKSFDIHSFNI